MEVDAQEPKYETALPFRLVPVTSEPLNTSRYKSSGFVQLVPWAIAQGPNFCSSLPPGSKWKHLIQPEGKPYFVLTGEFAFDIVTEANIEDEQTQGRILNCITMADNELHRKEIKLPPRCELFLELAEDSVCKYYFVDHIGKRLFWLEELSTEFLSIPSAASDSHLETEMERLYWLHVEFFPMHHESHEQEFRQVIDDLYNIVSHGQVDRLTSKPSMFPFTTEDCRDILKLLSKKRGQHMDGYTLCYSARLASVIARQRFVSFYGQRPAQLDRRQEMFPADVVQHKWLSTVANLLMWGIPRHYTSLLDELYVNEYVYSDDWTRFMTICLADWASSLSLNFPVLVASLLLTNMGGGTISASIPSVISCTVGIISASCLRLKHEPLAESGCTVGVRYLYSAKSRTVGFLPLSVAFGLPKAGYMWGVVFLAAQFLFVASQSIGELAALVTVSAIVVLIFLILFVTCLKGVCATSFFRSVTSLCVPYFSLGSPEAQQMV